MILSKLGGTDVSLPVAARRRVGSLWYTHKCASTGKTGGRISLEGREDNNMVSLSGGDYDSSLWSCIEGQAGSDDTVRIGREFGMVTEGRTYPESD